MNNKITHIFEYKITVYIMSSIVLIAGFLVRLYNIDSPVADWHSWRQADTASVSRIYAERGINLLFPRFYDISSIQSGKVNPEGFRFVEFPFYNALNVILYKAAPSLTLEVWARLITVLSAVVTGYFLFLLGKKYLGPWGGVLSSFFYLFIPFNIYFTRVILPDPLGTMLIVASLWFFSEFIDRQKNVFLFVSAIFASAALLVKPYFLFFLLPVALQLTDKYGIKQLVKDKSLRVKLVVYLTILFVPFFLWRAWEGRYPEGIPFYTWAFNGDGIRFRPAFWRWIFGERLGHLILGIWGIVPFILGLTRSKVKSNFIKYFALGALVYVVIVATANVRHDYYQIIVIPAVSLVLASGIVYLWNSDVFNKIFSRILAVFSIFMMLMIGWLQVKDNYNINHPEIIEAGKEIDKIAAEDALILAPYNGDTAFLYQTKRYGWPAIDDSVDNIILRGADYYVSVDLGSEDTRLVESRFKTIEKNSKFIIIDLHQSIGR